MIVSHDFVVGAPAEVVFDALTDATLLRAMNGVTLGGGDPGVTGREGAVTLDVGGARLQFRGRVEAVEADREAGAVTLTLTGRRGRSRSSSRCLVAMRLRSSDGFTKVSTQLDLEVPGPDAPSDAEPLSAAVLTLMEDFAGAVRERAEQAVSVVHRSLPTPAAGAPPPPPVARRPRYADLGTTVPGRVVVVTDGPLDGSTLPVGDTRTERLRGAAKENPWAPAAILLAITLLLVLRRRRRKHHHPAHAG